MCTLWVLVSITKSVARGWVAPRYASVKSWDTCVENKIKIPYIWQSISNGFEPCLENRWSSNAWGSAPHSVDKGENYGKRNNIRMFYQ